jgi:hypothetical protein
LLLAGRRHLVLVYEVSLSILSQLLRAGQPLMRSATLTAT